MSDDIYESMIQNKGKAYRDSQIKSYSHYNEPVDRSEGRLAGNSRVWGDASPEVQSRVIDSLIDASKRAGLSNRETAYVLSIAREESGFNPDAAAGTTSASGIGQFTNATGAGLKDHKINDQNRFDTNAQSQALVELFIENRNLANKRGQGEEYIYKYHHDGPSKDYGGLGISNKDVMPKVDEYERFVDKRLGQNQTSTEPGKDPPQAQPQKPAPTPATTGGQPGFKAAMETMLPPVDGKHAHVTGHAGETRAARPGVAAHQHGGTDFNYVGGQSGVNLKHPAVHSPVSGTVEIVKGSNFNTVGVRDAQGNLHQFLHLDTQLVKDGQKIQAGDEIGTMGNKGPKGSNYPQHVHYQIKGPDGKTIDPEKFWEGRKVEKTPGGQDEKSKPEKQDASTTRTKPESAMADGVLKEGDRGPQVKALQENLNKLGYAGKDGKPLETSSEVFGPNTKFALESFQKAHELKVDGQAGKATLPALAQAEKTPLISEANHPANGMYRAISADPEIKRLGVDPRAVANATKEAVQEGITDPQVKVNADRGLMMVSQKNGADPGQRTVVELSAPKESMQDISNRAAQDANWQSQNQQQDNTQTKRAVVPA